MAARRKADLTTMPAITPTSPAVVLAYAGGRLGRFVPARDLTGADLGRIVYRRAALLEQSQRSSKVRPGEAPVPPRRPGPATADDVSALADELIATGAFVALIEPIPPASPAQPEA